MSGWLNRIDLGTLSDRELLLLAVQQLNDLCSMVQVQNERIGKLEAWRDKAAGVLLVLMIGVPATVATAIAWLFK